MADYRIRTIYMRPKLDDWIVKETREQGVSYSQWMREAAQDRADWIEIRRKAQAERGGQGEEKGNGAQAV